AWPNQAAKNRYLFVDGKLCASPTNAWSMFKKLPPFTKPLITSLWKEPFHRRSNEQDESIYSFVRRRLGPEFADIAIDALCRGIFAGDCRKLSVQACFPPLYEMEKKYGSLIAGAVFGFKDPKVEATGLVRRAIEDKWASWSLSKGLQQLTDAMAASIQNTKEGEIRLDTKVTSLKPNQNGKII
ncbi:protoporphyrinogen oxidase, partial [Biomphalaria glabrata]